MALRILSSFILLFSIFFMPFWVSVILALGAMLYFDLFWEAIPIFLLSDLLYGVNEIRFYNVTYVSFLLSSVLLFVIEFIKKESIFYPNKLKF